MVSQQQQLYRLSISDQVDLWKRNAPNSDSGQRHEIDDVFVLPGDERIVCIRRGTHLVIYRFEAETKNASAYSSPCETGTWKEMWKIDDIFDPQSLDTVANHHQRQFWHATKDFFLSGQLMLVLRGHDGVRFYQQNGNRLIKVRHDGSFDHYTGWNRPEQTFLMGKIYPDEKSIGFLTRGVRLQTEFYVANEQTIEDEEEDYPIWPLHSELDLSSPSWTAPGTRFYFSDVQRRGRDDVVLRNVDGTLEVYRFRPDYQLELVLKSNQLLPNSLDDHLLFANLTRSNYKDLLLVSESGLFIYQHRDGGYKMIHCHQGFRPEYIRTSRLMDINGDGLDDLIYTGPGGVEAMTFDLQRSVWFHLMEGGSLGKNGQVFGAAFVAGQPIIWIENDQQNISWACIAPVNRRGMSSSPKLTENPEVFKTGAPVSNRIGSGDVIASETAGSSPVQQKVSSSKQGPIPTLRWDEQWKISSLISAENAIVSPTGDAIQLLLPVVDFVDPWSTLTLRLFMTYQSSVLSTGNSRPTGGLLGDAGWSLPLTSEFIQCDSAGNISRDDSKCSISFAPDIVRQLKSVRVEGSGRNTKFHYDLLDEGTNESSSKITAIYMPDENKWIVHSTLSTLVYGGTESSTCYRSALANWQGLSSAETNFIDGTYDRFPFAWFLVERHFKVPLLAPDGISSLFYHYETDSDNFGVTFPSSKNLDPKLWTSSIRLKKITSNTNQLSLTFHYAMKTSQEAKVNRSSPVRDELIHSGKKQMIFHPSVAMTDGDRYLNGYTLFTATYQQEMRLIYDVKKVAGQKDPLRIFVGLQQVFQHQTETLLKFDYDSTSSLLSSVESVTAGIKSEFLYEKRPLATAWPATDQPIANYALYGDWPSIAQGGIYTVIADVTSAPSNTRLSLKVIELSEDGSTTLMNEHFYFHAEASGALDNENGAYLIEAVKIQAFDDYFALIVNLIPPTNEKDGTVRFISELCLFHRQVGNRWTRLPQYRITFPRGFGQEGSLAGFTNDFVFVQESGRNEVVIKEMKQSNWRDKRMAIPRPLVYLTLMNNGKTVVGYDDVVLCLFHRSADGAMWSRTELNVGGNIKGLYSSAHKKFKDSFPRVKDGIRQRWTNIANTFALQSYQNAIIISGIETRNKRMDVSLHLILLDQRKFGNVALYQHKLVEGDALEGKKAWNGDAQLELKLFDNSWRVQIADITDELLEKLKKDNGNSKASKKDVVDAWNRQDLTKGGFDDAIGILLPPSKYVAHFVPPGLVVVGDHSIFIKSPSSGWIRQQVTKTSITDDVPLGDNFVLRRATKEEDGKNEIYHLLAKKQTASAPLATLDPVKGSVHSKFPLYLTYKSRASNVSVILTFRDNGKALGRIHTLPAGEQVLPVSDFQHIVTTIKSGEIVQCRFRSVRSLLQLEPTLLAQPFEIIRSITDSSLLAKNPTRRTGYRSSSTRKDGHTFQHRLQVIPANDEKIAGRTEFISSRNLLTGNRTDTVNHYDATGRQVELTPGEKQRQEEESGRNSNSLPEENLSHSSQLWDRSGRWPVADFSPFQWQDQMFSYFGFESYETNRIGSTSSWIFDKENIVRGGFSLTGRSYLQLAKGYVRGLFEPMDQRSEAAYVGVAWLRSTDGKLLTTNTITSTLKADVSTTTGLKVVTLWGQVKYQTGDWSYVEVFVDFAVVRQLYDDRILGHHNQPGGDGHLEDSPSLEKVRFTVAIQVENGSQQQRLDVDHIAFRPIAMEELEVNVYNELEAMNPTAVIQLSDGLIRRIFYNSLGHEKATLDKLGHVERLSTLSQTGRLSTGTRTITPAALWSFQPQSGAFYETFDNFSLRNRWPSLTDNWETGPGRLTHSSPSVHRIHPLLFGTAESAALRCSYSLQQSTISALSWLWTGGQLELTTTSDFNNKARLSVSSIQTGWDVPYSGELILMIAQPNLLFIWVDGLLLVDRKTDQASLSSFAMEFRGPGVSIQDCFVMKDPILRVQYYNGWGENTQSVQMESANDVIISENLYDVLGRPAIKSKRTRVSRHRDGQLMAYRSDFITGVLDSLLTLQSTDGTSKLHGLVHDLNPADEGFPYSRTRYEPSPLGREMEKGMPGRMFAIGGQFTWRAAHNHRPDPSTDGLSIVEILFPSTDGFNKKIETEPNGRKKVTVSDGRGKMVGIYIRSLGFDHFLSTYEYDEAGRVVRILPPVYHETAGTLNLPISWPEQLIKCSKDEPMATVITYDKSSGKVTKKRTPDAGTLEYIYSDDKINFVVHYNSSKIADGVTFFEYNDWGRVSRTGHLLPAHLPINSRINRTTLTRGKDDTEESTINNGPFVTRLPSVEELEARFLVDDELDTQAKEKADDYYGIKRKDFQLVDFNGRHPDPLRRKEMQRALTHNGDGPGSSVWVSEEHLSFYNVDHQVKMFRTKIAREFATTNGTASNEKVYPVNVDLKKIFDPSERLVAIVYPDAWAGSDEDGSCQLVTQSRNDRRLHKLALIHRYNSMGQLISLGVNGQEDLFARFTYNGDGSLATEEQRRNETSNYTRRFAYNTAGFLQSLSDPFMEQEIDHSGSGYGQPAFGDGHISRITFKTHWTSDSDSDDAMNQLKETDRKYWTFCIRALETAGYLSKSGEPIREFYRHAENGLPLVCTYGDLSQRLAHWMEAKRRPATYGHSFAYGNHRQLIKAKYFASNNIHQPLQPHSFRTHTGGKMTSKQSFHLWQLLGEKRYLLAIGSDNPQATAKIGRSIFRLEDLKKNFKKFSTDVSIHAMSIEKLAIDSIRRRRPVTGQQFENLFFKWEMQDDATKEVAGQLYKLLKDDGYLPTAVDDFRPLDKEFVRLMSGSDYDYKKHLPEIVDAFWQCLTYGLGESPFDAEAYNIDANGNHRLFYTGFERHELDYRAGTNQVEKIKVNYGARGKEFVMRHDSQGNVVQALHKGIDKIEYDPTSQRTSSIRMTDGRLITFAYDVKGERSVKSVWVQDETDPLKRILVQEIRYVRDEDGRVLADRKIVYHPSGKKIIRPVTPPRKTWSFYIYGPRCLVGFVRNGEYYNVTTDHAGSTKLVLKDGRVIAAYDYLPYGQLMRSFGPDTSIVDYLYTGQEWDRETGLYNYHYRLYDPQIGRFYQIDPKEQFFSPYVYAGNSPLSLVDPDGQFALMICLAVGFGVAGAYIGASAANQDFRFWKWDWESGKTWFGLIGGGVTGALAPYGVAGSFAVLSATWLGTAGAGVVLGSIGLAGGWIGGVASNRGEMNPVKWNWKDPSTIYNVLSGVSIATGMIGSVAGAHKFGLELLAKKGTFAYIAFAGTTGVIVVGAAYGSSVLINNGEANPAKWNWKENWAEMLFSSMFVVESVTQWPMSTAKIANKFHKTYKAINYSSITMAMSKLEVLKTLMKNLKLSTPMVKRIAQLAVGAGFGALFGVTYTGTDDYDVTNYNAYIGILNGLFSGWKIGRKGPKMIKNIPKQVTKVVKMFRKGFEPTSSGPVWQSGLAGSVRQFESETSSILSDVKSVQSAPLPTIPRNVEVIKLRRVQTFPPRLPSQNNDSIYVSPKIIVVVPPTSHQDDGNLKPSGDGAKPQKGSVADTGEQLSTIDVIVSEFNDGGSIDNRPAASNIQKPPTTGQREKRQLRPVNESARCQVSETTLNNTDYSWTPPTLRRRRWNHEISGASRSGATRPQNWITLSLDAVSLLLGGDARKKTLIASVDQHITNFVNQNDRFSSKANSGQSQKSFDLHCRPFVVIGKDYHLFNGQWTCLSPGGQSVVFENSPSSESAQVSSGNGHFNRFQGDEYERETCRPVEWNGRPSVTCKGKKSTFIHTPFAKTAKSPAAETASTIFTSLDGWLMLARVAPTACRTIARWFTGLSSSATPINVDRAISDHQKSEWMTQMDQLRLLVATGKDGHVKDHLKWAEAVLEDLQMDLNDLNGFYRRCGITETDERFTVESVIQLMSERITALKEDLLYDEMEYAAMEETAGDCVMQLCQLFSFKDVFVMGSANLCYLSDENSHRTVDLILPTAMNNCTLFNNTFI